uniref:Uncharacterized protein n=1 Tax=Lepeophtheirus salmonis TaxID=72036 RepID=A0A0K2TRR2_LEPSM
MPGKSLDSNLTVKALPRKFSASTLSLKRSGLKRR